MKRIIVIFSLFLSFCFNCVASTLYVYDSKTKQYQYVDNKQWCDPSLKGYKIDGGIAKPGCIIYYGLKNGYTCDELYTWYNNKDYNYFFVLKAFTSDIYYVVVTNDVKPDEFNNEYVNGLFKDFVYENDFDKKSALNGKIRQTFLENIVGKKAVNGVLEDTVNEYKYKFKNGYLSSYTLLNGLSYDANQYINTKIGQIIKRNAETKHTNKNDIIKEINFQFWCLFNMPTDEVKLAYNDIYKYNIALIYFSLYKKNVTLSEFKFYVPNANTIEVAGNKIILSYGSMIYIFTNKILTDVK